LPTFYRPQLKLTDSAAFDILYYSLDVKYGTYEPFGTWTTYHANGQLQSVGSYLPYNFTRTEYGYDTTKTESYCLPKGSVIMYSTETKMFLRDGKWNYYDEKGNLIREEYYLNGLLKAKVEY
jgi:antitoxin component YwqK of YwqJK toxin-antitoxin module